jgi:hypothetical protein
MGHYKALVSQSRQRGTGSLRWFSQDEPPKSVKMSKNICFFLYWARYSLSRFVYSLKNALLSVCIRSRELPTVPTDRPIVSAFAGILRSIRQAPTAYRPSWREPAVDRPANNHCFCGSFIVRVTSTVGPVGLCAIFLALHMRMSFATNRRVLEVISVPPHSTPR